MCPNISNFPTKYALEIVICSNNVWRSAQKRTKVENVEPTLFHFAITWLYLYNFPTFSPLFGRKRARESHHFIPRWGENDKWVRLCKGQASVLPALRTQSSDSEGGRGNLVFRWNLSLLLGDETFFLATDWLQQKEWRHASGNQNRWNFSNCCAGILLIRRLLHSAYIITFAIVTLRYELCSSKSIWYVTKFFKY